MKARGVHLQYSFETAEQRGAALHNPLFDLLSAVHEHGSIQHAAKALGASYRHIWGALKRWEETLGEPLVTWAQGQPARLTPFADRMLWAETRARTRLVPHIEALRAELERVLADALDGSQHVLTVFASHDLALPLLRDTASAGHGLHIDLRFAGSVDALRALAQGRCLVAGFHVPPLSGGSALFSAALKPLLKPGVHKLIGGVRRTQGLMVRPREALRVRGLPDLAGPAGQQARFVNRQPGSGTRLLMDHLLAEQGIAPAQVRGYFDAPEDSHLAVAAAIASGAGDVGPAAGGELLSAPAEFVTAPLTDRPFLFLVYGDNRDRDADHLAVIRAMQPEQPDLIVQTGDMVSKAGDEGQWRRYFAAAAPLLRSVPMFPALGNHELRGDPDAGRFFRFFVLPMVVPPLGQAPPGPGLADLAAPGPFAEPPPRRRRPVYYAFRYSNSLFVALDGNSPYDGDQAAWLERTLGEAQHDQTVRHLFVFVHQPPYAVGAYCGSERLQRRIVPLLQRAARGPRPLLRAVFAGHEHAYQHLERGGVRYFITGGGGAPLYPRSQSCDREDDLALRLFRAEHHYLRIQVDGQAATLLALSRSGEVMERVLLHEPVVLDEAPLALLPTETPTETPTLRPGQPGQPGGAAGRERTSGPILLLWVSAIATLSGLLLLTRPSRRRDLSPSSRRYRDDEEA